jgi:hypothetical protein
LQSDILFQAIYEEETCHLGIFILSLINQIFFQLFFDSPIHNQKDILVKSIQLYDHF